MTPVLANPVSEARTCEIVQCELRRLRYDNVVEVSTIIINSYDSAEISLLDKTLLFVRLRCTFQVTFLIIRRPL